MIPTPVPSARAPGADEPAEAARPEDRRVLPGRLAYYHANGKGTGIALRLELRLSRNGADRYDCFFLEMARQKTAAVRNGDERNPATFDWAAKATVKLDFADVCELLAVLEGRLPQAGGERNGLYHASNGSNTLIGFRRSEQPAGYSLSLSRKDREGNQVFKGQMLLGETEAIGLRCVFQSALFFLVFHRNLRG